MKWSKNSNLFLSLLLSVSMCAISVGVGMGATPVVSEASGQVTPPAAQTVIQFKDQKLKASLLQYMKDRHIIKADAQDITPAEAEKLGPVPGDVTNTYRLTFGSHEIKDLTGMQYFKNLTELELDQNQIEDIQPLAALTKLTVLNLAQNKISDITPLAQMKNLKDLQLNDNQIKDITPLQNLTELTDLSLARNGVTDITPLAGLTKLTKLDLSSNKISDIKPLAQMKSLNNLQLNDNQIKDITPLAALTDVTDLNLAINKITKIDTLKNLTKLKNLALGTTMGGGNEVSDITPLAGLTTLSSLNLCQNKISDISALQGLTKLTDLNASSNSIEKLDALKSLNKLSTLDVSYNCIKDISPVKGLNLAQFTVNGQKIKLQSNEKETPLTLKYADQLIFDVDADNAADGKVENAKFILNKFPHTGDVVIMFNSGDTLDGISINGLGGENYSGTITISYGKQNPDPQPPTPPVQNQKTVKFNKKDGSVLTTVKVEAGKKIAATAMPAAPTEEGLTFKEWNTQQDGQGKAFTVDTVVSEDLTVYAIYTKKTVPVPQPPTPPQPQPSQSKGQVTVDPTTPAGSTVNEQPSIRPHKVAKTGEAANAVTYVSLLAYAFVGLEILRSRK